jgi:hypothetical protein
VIEPIADFAFSPDMLRPEARPRGVSAFMRIRNGAYALEAAIRSHIGHFDEIVALYNRCTDETPDILARLAAEFGPKLRVYHYLPEVFPPGSDGHRTEPANSPRSLVAYYNAALSLTRFSHATKLDDDHVAMGAATARLLADVRAGRTAVRDLACFSGLNLARDRQGRIGILASEPFSGSGDIAVFPVTPGSYFVHDPRFERFKHDGLKRRFHSLVYWHLKYLKPEFGFSNYDLAENPQSRYWRRLKRLEQGIVVEPLDRPQAPGWRSTLERFGLPMPDRDRVIGRRDRAGFVFRQGLNLQQALADAPELSPFVTGQTP